MSCPTIKRIAGLIPLIALFSILFPIETRASFPIVKNFSRHTYSGGSQNWAVSQDGSGAMLFGNNEGLLLFDSRSWQKANVLNKTAVRSVLADDESRRIYVGASYDFGYFEPDSANNRPRYRSLVPALPENTPVFSDVWHIMKKDRDIWFQTDYMLICCRNGACRHIESQKKITASAIFGTDIYVGFQDGGLARVNGEELGAMPSADLIHDKICALLPMPGNRLLVVTSFSGLFLFDGSEMHKYNTDIDSFLQENQCFSAAISENEIIFGTVNNGAVIKNFLTGENTFINVDSGLQNNTVLGCGFDNLGNIWLCLDNGIDYVQMNSPVRNLLGAESTFGTGYVTLLKDKTLYLGTNQGLYAMQYPAPAAARIPDVKSLLKGQVWNIDTIGQTLFISSDAGIYYGTGPSLRKIENAPGAWSVTPIKTKPGYAMASTYDDFYLLHRTPAGTWVADGKIKGYSDVGGRPLEDSDGQWWIGHWLKGVYRLKPDKDFTKFTTVKLYTSAHGLPSDNDNVVMRLFGEIVVSTADDIYRFDRASGTFVPEENINHLLGPTSTSRIYTSPAANEAWVVSYRGVNVLSGNIAGSAPLSPDSLTYRRLAKNFIPGYEQLNFVTPNKILVPCRDGFYEVSTNRPITPPQETPPRITAVYANQDSLLYAGIIFVDNARTLTVPYSLNSLRFEYLSGEFCDDEAVHYSVMLENYDKQWSPLSDATGKEYTHLHEGDYVFHVKAVDDFTGHTAFTTLPFTVLPPWYRSSVAKLFYFILVLVTVYFCWIAFRIYSRRAATAMELRKNREMEEINRAAQKEALEKDFEIERLKSEKLEYDFKHKTAELSNIIMNVIRKNEILLDISDHLTHIQGSLSTETTTKIDKQIEKIKSLISENISHDDDWKNFTSNFDVVYENYLARLSKEYPILTPADLRLCAYLKMGLSSKDIAPLMNITFRSVEMSRYRLRKKLGLDRAVNLTEFLSNF